MSELGDGSSGPFTHVKAGDTVYRRFAGRIMTLTVDRVDAEIIYTTGGWMFERATGVEFDPRLGWGSGFGATGSYLVPAPE